MMRSLFRLAAPVAFAAVVGCSDDGPDGITGGGGTGAGPSTGAGGTTGSGGNGTCPTGEACFAEPDVYAISPGNIAAGDIDGDGHLDLVGVNAGTGILETLIAMGDGTFAQGPTTMVPEANRIVSAEFTGDAYADVAVGLQGLDEPVRIWASDGTGNFSLAQSFPGMGGSVPELWSGDTNGDGNEELVRADKDGVVFYVSDGVGGLTPQAAPHPNLVARGLDVGDLDGDGVANDVAAADAYDLVLFVDGEASWTETPASGAFAIAIADYDGDGRGDVVTRHFQAENFSLWIGKGNGDLLPPTAFDVDGDPTDVESGDFNGDGLPDVAVSVGITDRVLVYLGDGSGGLTEAADLRAEDTPASLVVEDFNGDGRDDIAVANNQQPSVSVFLSQN